MKRGKKDSRRSLRRETFFSIDERQKLGFAVWRRVSRRTKGMKRRQRKESPVSSKEEVTEIGGGKDGRRKSEIETAEGSRAAAFLVGIDNKHHRLTSRSKRLPALLECDPLADPPPCSPLVLSFSPP
eukprot:338003-Hanusia_phi.AAC.2